MRTNMWLSLLGGGLNILLNYLLMFAPLGWPSMGILGAGWATLTTRWTIFFIYLGYVRHLQQKRLIVVPTAEALKGSWKKVIQLGLPGGLDLGSKMAYLNLLTHLMMGWLGPCHQKAGSVLFFAMNIVSLIPVGVVVAGSILMGRALLKGPQAQRTICKIGYGLLAVMVAFSSLLLWWVWPLACRLMEANQTVVEIATPLLPLLLWVQAFDAFSYLPIYLLRGLRDTMVPFAINLMVYSLIGFPASYLLGSYFGFGMAGILQGLVLSFFSTSLILGWRLHRQIAAHRDFFHG